MYISAFENTKNKMMKWYILLVVMAVAIATNPDVRDHRDVVKEQIAEAMQYNPNNFVFDALFGTAIKRIVYRENWAICSLTTIHFDGATHVVGVGAFGYVWLFNKELLNFM